MDCAPHNGDGSSVLLVVDDYPENLISMRALLQRDDWLVVTAASGVEALELLLQHDVDLVLLDVMMPGMDGPGTLQALRALPDVAPVPVAFMTAKVQPNEVAHYRSLGALDVIAKPFDPMTLPAQVRAVWERRHA